MTEITTLPADKLKLIQESLPYFIPELVLSGGIVLILLAGLIFRSATVHYILTVVTLLVSIAAIILHWSHFQANHALFGMLHSTSFSTFLKILFDIATILTVAMSWQKEGIRKHTAEYTTLLLTVTLGAHLIVMSTNLVMIFLSLELMSISSYILTGYLFKRESAEGSLKYFLFGSVASAVMLYGFTLLYGITGTTDISSDQFFTMLNTQSPAFTFAAIMLSLSGFLFKIAATPLHPWAPDVYDASPMPVVAFFSVVPKLAGIGVLAVFIHTAHIATSFDWQLVLGVIALLTIIIGNFSALKQRSPKRLMAYSSIAQSGFLLLGVLVFSSQGLHFMLFYATVYMLGNFVVFINLQLFEAHNLVALEDFKGTGKRFLWPHILALVGFISLTGIPPTAGFTAKLFIFTSLWESFEMTGKSILLWLLVIGLLNTVVALFYYLRIPFFAFMKSGTTDGQIIISGTFKKLLAFLLVLLILVLFLQPDLLMSLINRINFVL